MFGRGRKSVRKLLSLWTLLQTGNRPMGHSGTGSVSIKQPILEDNLISQAMACLSNLGKHFGCEKHFKTRFMEEKKRKLKIKFTMALL